MGMETITKGQRIAEVFSALKQKQEVHHRCSKENVKGSVVFFVLEKNIF